MPSLNVREFLVFVIFCLQFSSQKWLHQFYGCLELCSFCRKASMPIKFLVLGGGVFWVLWWGVPILFLWARGCFWSKPLGISIEGTFLIMMLDFSLFNCLVRGYCQWNSKHISCNPFSCNIDRKQSGERVPVCRVCVCVIPSCWYLMSRVAQNNYAWKMIPAKYLWVVKVQFVCGVTRFWENLIIH